MDHATTEATTKAAANQGGGRRLPPEGRRWVKGQSGNPSGRNQWAERRDFEAAMRRLLQERGDELAEAMFDRAKRDARFAALLLERIWPVPKHVVVEAAGPSHAEVRAGLIARIEAIRERLAETAGVDALGPIPCGKN